MKNVNNTGTKNKRHFGGKKNGEYAACLKNSVHMFVEKNT
jgi:hypothetical protein